MVNKIVKNRKHVDWYALRLELGDPDVEYYYWLHFKSVKTKKTLSLNRKSYWALLHVYGKQRLDAYRASGVWL